MLTLKLMLVLVVMVMFGHGDGDLLPTLAFSRSKRGLHISPRTKEHNRQTVIGMERRINDGDPIAMLNMNFMYVTQFAQNTPRENWIPVGIEKQFEYLISVRKVIKNVQLLYKINDLTLVKCTFKFVITLKERHYTERKLAVNCLE